MQMPAATAIACSTIARASSGLDRTRASAAAIANGPPEPMPITPSSGSIRSPVPDRRYGKRGSATRSIAARRRSARSGRPLEVAPVLVELALESSEQSEAVGRRAGKAGEHAIVIEPPHLARRVLDDGLAERHLSVAGHDHLALVADGEYGRCVGCHAGRN